MKAKEKGKLPSSPPANPYQVSKWSGATDSETEEEAQVRIQVMQEAANRSKGIDLMIQESKKELDRRRKGVKILLLGQSESGKSSVLKNFQLAFAPRYFENERPIWKTVIQLNIISSIKTILEALKEEYESAEGHLVTPVDSSSQSAQRFLRRMRLSLSPLFFIEANLVKLLAPECTDSRDLTVRAGNGWKALLRAQRNHNPSATGTSISRRRSQTTLGNENDPSSILVAQRDDILELWQSPEVREILKRRRPHIREHPGFFMDDLARIATPNYIPTDHDVIRARIRTMGVEESHFVLERAGPGMNTDFYITDVGGSRSQRASWAPFFDDVQAILFLAPLAFNQVLDEDRRVNRLEDSLYLWKDICSNKLLANANLILFFNKRDVLVSLLESGVQVKKYVTTYDLANDVATVTKYFRDRFRTYHKKYSPDSTRPFMCYETSAIDIKAMSVLLTGVREAILRQHLREGDML
ncbi:heterotrimeric GTP-binding alpha subunit [Gymnopilus junonius]|uniref:Heterotrimeric GTP-binding alpha subunit n=1 Tax=Gymnopilus junonius TaxID=109634 RepID=A0A9P5NDS0_GYMJU|nr:heterotrimeric GTP-binding alpha subunit [Gymnopilus junonius]